MDDLRTFAVRIKNVQNTAFAVKKISAFALDTERKIPGYSTALIAKRLSPNAEAPSFFVRHYPTKPSFPFTNTSSKAMACERPAA